jgi:hypothetical protein
MKNKIYISILICLSSILSINAQSDYYYYLDTNNSETNINISNYPNGFYAIALVCNGQIVDAKTLIKH